MHYYGYKIHAVCSIDGVFKSFDISKVKKTSIRNILNLMLANWKGH